MTRYDMIWRATADYLAGASALRELVEIAEEVAWSADDDPVARAFASLVLRAEAELDRGDSDEEAVRDEIRDAFPLWVSPGPVSTGSASDTITGLVGAGTRRVAASA